MQTDRTRLRRGSFLFDRKDAISRRDDFRVRNPEPSHRPPMSRFYWPWRCGPWLLPCGASMPRSLRVPLLRAAPARRSCAGHVESKRGSIAAKCSSFCCLAGRAQPIRILLDVLRRTVQRWRLAVRKKVQRYHGIISNLQPGARNVKLVLWSDVPEASRVAAVNPERTLA